MYMVSMTQCAMLSICFGAVVVGRVDFLVVLVCVFIYHARGDKDVICPGVVGKPILAGVQ